MCGATFFVLVNTRACALLKQGNKQKQSQDPENRTHLQTNKHNNNNNNNEGHSQDAQSPSEKRFQSRLEQENETLEKALQDKN